MKRRSGMEHLIYKQIQNMIEHFVDDLSKPALFIKHYDNKEVNKSELLSMIPENLPATCYYHEYQPDSIYDAYEPFLSWIRLSYINFYQDILSIEEFFKQAGVYSLHIEPFTSFIKERKCQRTEDIMPIEVKFERQKFAQDIVKTIHFISREHPLILILSSFHNAPLASVQMIVRLLKEELINLHFIVIYNDTYYIKPYIADTWQQMIEYIEDCNLLVEWGSFSSNTTMIPVADFVFETKYFDKNMKKLWNMYHCLALEDASYFINDIYNKFEHNHSILDEQQAFEVLKFYTLLNILIDDLDEAIMACKTIPELNLYHQDALVCYDYHYLNIRTQLSTGMSDSIRLSYEKCLELARSLWNDFLLFKAELIYVMAQFGGWKDLFLCDFRIPISPELLTLAEQYHFLNHLAYLYAMGFENDIESVRAIANNERSSYYFAKGIQLANEIGNNDFLMSAYMKNIIIYSDAGFHDYVYKMHKKRIETVSSNDIILQAHMYLGIGYNCIILEFYEKADQYFRIALRNLVQARKPDDCMDALYNIVMNFFVIEDYTTVIPIIEILLKMLSYLGYQNIMVCNRSKLYAMLAISYFHLDNYYKAYHYLGQMKIYMPQLSGDGLEFDATYWEEELFLYYYLKAILHAHENNLTSCKQELDQANNYLWKLPGTVFYTNYLYTIALANYYEAENNEPERTKAITTAIDYYKQQGFMQCASKLESVLKHEQPSKVILNFREHELMFNKLLDIANYEGTQNKLKQREKDISFLTIWQENLNNHENNVNTLIHEAISIIQNTYGLGGAVLLKKEMSKYSILYKNNNFDISANQMAKIFNFFQQYKRGFLTHRTDKNFLQFLPILRPFHGQKIVSMLGIPISDGNINYVLLSYVVSQRNFTGNRFLLSSESLATIKFATNQLVDTIKRITDNNLIREMNEKLERASLFDYLTGCYNRHGLSDIIENKLNAENNKTNLILYIDMDNFKYYNDTFGHDIGDVLLKEFSNILTKLAGTNGYTVRYGGDEFLIVIPNQTESYGINISDMIYDHIEDGFIHLLEKQLDMKIVIPSDKKLSCSIGIAEYSGHTQEDIDRALKNADSALYFIKRNLKGRAITWSKYNEFNL